VFETLNANIERGEIDLKEGTNDDMFQSHNKNESIIMPRKNINGMHENGDGPKVVTNTTLPNKIYHINLH